MPAKDPAGTARKDAHKDSKTGKTEARKNLSEADKEAILRDTGADFVNVTEIIIKYEILRKGEKRPIMKELSLDPAVFDTIVLSPQKCDQIDRPTDGSGKKHTFLKADGTDKNWQELKQRHGAKIEGPRDSKERGKFHSGHSPLCIHDETCNWYCVRDDGEEEHGP